MIGELLHQQRMIEQLEERVKQLEAKLREDRQQTYEDAAKIAGEKLEEIMVGNYAHLIEAYIGRVTGAIRARAKEMK